MYGISLYEFWQCWSTIIIILKFKATAKNKKELCGGEDIIT